MNISECSYCGKLSLNENNVCSDCSAALGEPVDFKPNVNKISSQIPNFHQPRPQTTESTNYTEESPRRTYIPVNCWKCDTLNNFALSKICQKCGCYLREYEQVRSSRNLQSNPFLEKLSVKSFVWILVIVISGISLVGLYRITSNPLYIGADPKTFNLKDKNAPSSLSENLTLPHGNWYHANLWSYLFKYPSAKQILQRNIEVTGDAIKSEDVQSMAIKGDFSAARGECITQACANEIYNLSKVTVPVEELKTSDVFERSYKDIGTMEIFVKKPDRSLRKISVIIPTEEAHKTEITEVVNGMKAMKKTTYFNSLGEIKNTKTEDLNGKELTKIKDELTSMWKNASVSSGDMKFLGVRRVNSRIAYMLEHKKEGKPSEILYFDSVNGFLIKADREEFTMYFEDYKDYKGVKVPFLMYFKSGEKGGFVSWVKFRINDWKINENIDDAVFADAGS